MQRREFLLGTMALTAGCMSGSLKLGKGGAMQGYAVKPMARVKVAISQLDDGHGLAAINRLLHIPGVEITAVWDPDPAQIAKAQALLKKAGRKPALAFSGPEGWKGLADTDAAEVIYNCCRDAKLHTPITLRAMNAGKHAFTEILAELPGAICDDDCWALVEASENNRVNCMMLECCVYGEYEMLALNLARKGLLGELVRLEGGYVHDQRNLQFKKQPWRLSNALEKVGNFYPTHAIAPISRTLSINRGDRFTQLVSMESSAAGFESYARNEMKGTEFENVAISRGDANITLIRTAKGKIVSLVHDVASPQPYDRLHLVSGTKGIFRGHDAASYRVTFENKTDDGQAHKWFGPEAAAQVKALYAHPLWKSAKELTKEFGGFGNMSFLMDLRWAFCLQNGLPLDSDVYDLATWGSIVDASSRSVKRGSNSVELPDFTRGGWQTAKPCVEETVDLAKMG